MKKYLKLIPILTTIVFAVMWYSSDMQLKSQKLAYTHQAVKYIKGKTKVVYKDKVIDRIIYREIKPDGTITEKIEEKETDKSKIDTTTTENTEKTPIFAPQSTKDWIIGIGYPFYENSQIFGNFELKRLSMEVNRRILGDIYMGVETNLNFDRIMFQLKLVY